MVAVNGFAAFGLSYTPAGIAPGKPPPRLLLYIFVAVAFHCGAHCPAAPTTCCIATYARTLPYATITEHFAAVAVLGCRSALTT